MEGIFVIGADTNVGKTVISAGLLKAMHGFRKATYWKPVQTGTIVGDDTKDVKTVTQCPPECFMEPAYRFPDPMAPRNAAKNWGKTIDLAAIVEQFKKRPNPERFLVVEGAGGLLVPMNDEATQKDLIKALGLPVLLVSEDRIGAINHTVLTIEALRHAGVEICGVVLTKAQGKLGNAENISHFGKVEILAEIPPYEDTRTIIAQVSCHPRLRKLLDVPLMPA